MNANLTINSFNNTYLNSDLKYHGGLLFIQHADMSGANSIFTDELSQYINGTSLAGGALFLSTIKQVTMTNCLF